MKDNKNLLYPELSYRITGLLFKVHNEIGQFGREKQYGDMLEKLLGESGIKFEREKPLPLENIPNKFTNKVDFAINSEILLDLKAKPIIPREDYVHNEKIFRRKWVQIRDNCKFLSEVFKTS